MPSYMYLVLVQPANAVLVRREVGDDAGDIEGAARLDVQVGVTQDLSPRGCIRKTRAPIGAWKCNFPPFRKLCQTDRPTNQPTNNGRK